MSHNQHKATAFVKTLDQQIDAMYRTNVLDDRDMKERRALVSRLNAVVAKIDRNARLELFGSSAIPSIATLSSDLDLGITGVPVAVGHRVFARLLKALYPLQHQFGKVTPIKFARVPLIKLGDGSDGAKFKCDISVINPVHPHKTALVAEYCAFDKRVAPLISIVKNWAKAREIGDASRGFFNSFALSLLVIASLQVTTPPVLPCLQQHIHSITDTKSGDATPRDTTADAYLKACADSKLPPKFLKSSDFTAAYHANVSPNYSSVADLAVQFFTLYANHFDPATMAVSVRQGGFVHAAPYREGKHAIFSRPSPFAAPATDDSEPYHQSTHVCCEDPIDPTDNVSRAVREAGSWPIIRAELIRARDLLSQTGAWKVAPVAAGVLAYPTPPNLSELLASPSKQDRAQRKRVMRENASHDAKHKSPSAATAAAPASTAAAVVIVPAVLPAGPVTGVVELAHATTAAAAAVTELSTAASTDAKSKKSKSRPVIRPPEGAAATATATTTAIASAVPAASAATGVRLSAAEAAAAYKRAKAEAEARAAGQPVPAAAAPVSAAASGSSGAAPVKKRGRKTKQLAAAAAAAAANPPETRGATNASTHRGPAKVFAIPLNGAAPALVAVTATAPVVPPRMLSRAEQQQQMQLTRLTAAQARDVQHQKLAEAAAAAAAAPAAAAPIVAAAVQPAAAPKPTTPAPPMRHRQPAALAAPITVSIALPTPPAPVVVVQLPDNSNGQSAAAAAQRNGHHRGGGGNSSRGRGRQARPVIRAPANS